MKITLIILVFVFQIWKPLLIGTRNLRFEVLRRTDNPLGNELVIFKNPDRSQT